MQVGRPTDYEDTYPEMLIEHFKSGLSFEAFGGVIGVSKQTLYTWTEKYPEFMDAKQRGLMMSRMVWEKMGIDGLYNQVFKDSEGATVSKSINAAIWRMNMINRFGWGEKNSVEVSGPEGKPIETISKSDLTDEQLELKIKALISEDLEE